MTRLVLVAGTTETARIEGISAAGSDPALRAHTPSADAEIIRYGRTVRSPVVPVSPTGCPTPAVVTRAVHELVGLDPVVVDAGLARPTAAPTVGLGARPGGDVRDGAAVPAARGIYERAREFGGSLPDDRLLIGETIPGGTTTALAVLRALGERGTVSSSLPENPLSLKRTVVEEALSTGDLSPGGAAGDPLAAVREVGDPVLAALAGVLAGCADAGIEATLAGGTQLAAAGALARHDGVDASLSLATSSFVADDDSADLAGLAADLDLTLSVTDPAFDRSAHPAMTAYAAGEAKEGVGMGGALSFAQRAGVSTTDLHDRIAAVYDRVAGEESP